MAEILQELKDPNDTKTLQKVGRVIGETIIKAEMPRDLEGKIKQAYGKLAKRHGDPSPYVAIRSSATAEDLPDASFAGQQETYLNIKEEDLVVDCGREGEGMLCWSVY